MKTYAAVDEDTDIFSRKYFEDNAYRQRFRSGSYYQSSGMGSPTATVQILAQRSYPVPFIVSKSRAFDRIQIEVTTLINPSTIRLMIYSDDGNGYPNALVLDAGTVDSSTTGSKEIVINVTLLGYYWLVAKAITGSPTVRGSNTKNHLMEAQAATGNDATACLVSLTGTNIADSPFPAGAVTQGNAPSIKLRAT